MEYGVHLSDHSDYCHDMEKRFFFSEESVDHRCFLNFCSRRFQTWAITS